MTYNALSGSMFQFALKFDCPFEQASGLLLDVRAMCCANLLNLGNTRFSSERAFLHCFGAAGRSAEQLRSVLTMSSLPQRPKSMIPLGLVHIFS